VIHLPKDPRVRQFVLTRLGFRPSDSPPLAGTRLLTDSWVAEWSRKYSARLRGGGTFDDNDRMVLAEILDRSLKPRLVDCEPTPLAIEPRRTRGRPPRAAAVPDVEIFRWVERVRSVRRMKLTDAGAFGFVAELFPREKLTPAMVRRAYYRQKKRQAK